jgi:uncharacterized protein (DUF488 family)
METLCTIGYTKKSLRKFIQLLRGANVTKVVDVRLRNTSQLAGFAKKDDLAFVLGVCGIEYQHVLELAPTDELLDDYHASRDWDKFEVAFKALLDSREPLPSLLSAADGHAVICLLCTEDQADRCHRRLVAEYAASHDPSLVVTHLA